MIIPPEYCFEKRKFNETFSYTPRLVCRKKGVFVLARRFFASPLVSKLPDGFGLNANPATCVAALESSFTPT